MFAHDVLLFTRHPGSYDARGLGGVVNLLNRCVHPSHEIVRIYLGVLSVVKRGDLGTVASVHLPFWEPPDIRDRRTSSISSKDRTAFTRPGAHYGFLKFSCRLA